MITGIIPAAGEGNRWGKYQKELLPIGDNRWLIDNTVGAMNYAGASQLCIISSPNKISTHVNHFMKDKYNKEDIFFVIQREQLDIWGAIKAALPFTTGYNFFGMPDTLYDGNIFRNMIKDRRFDFVLGTFMTTTPERFGVIVNGEVINKEVLQKGTFEAWGTFGFSKEVSLFWEKFPPTDYTTAINWAIRNFGLHTVPMNDYEDFSTWEDYKKWVSFRPLH